MGRRLALLGSAAVLALAAFFAQRHAWPWPRLTTVAPIVVTSAYRDVADTLRRGETISDLFARQGMGMIDLASLTRDLGFEPRRLRAGLVFNFRQAMDEVQPSSVVVRTGPEERLRFSRASTGWTGTREAIRWTPEVVRVSGTIDHSLYVALDAAIPDEVLAPGERVRLAWDLADVYAWNIDFTRDIQPGDEFTVLVERLISEEGEQRFGRVLASQLRVSGKMLPAYRFTGEDGRPGFYDADANSLKRAFLRAPVEFRRISSNFSRSRYHPVLGISRRHQGTDYAADPGTPVMAAGDGAIVSAGWSGGYGNMVEIRHRNGITTRYGHLRGYAHGIHRGTIVSQGQTIGYVGSTGLASGPHLHYEFRVHGIAQDSRRVNLGEGRPIEPALRPMFETERARLSRLLGDSVGTEVMTVAPLGSD